MTRIRSVPLAVAVTAALIVVLPGWTAPAPPVTPTAAARDSGRPVVLVLPGRGLEGSDTASLRRVWNRALDQGIASVAGERLLDEDDLRLVWYADALEPGTRACRVGRGEEEVARPQRERRGAEWARDVGAALKSAGRLMGLVAEWMEGPEGEALRSMAGDLVYLGDDGQRCGAEERLAEALATAEGEGRPVILVAHSFGALVAYHHLQIRPDASPRIERWITVGSLLGYPELREVLLPGGGGTGVPAGIGSWVNVSDPRDPLAAPLVGIRSSPGDTVAIEDRTTEGRGAGNPHDPERYLSDPATARAVVEAWVGCSGATPDRPRASPGVPAACR